MERPITHRYTDPLDAIWLTAAARIGLVVRRGPESYATTDGRGTLTLSDQAGMDHDDSLAQMILHEICHSLVQGSQSFGWVDWGLDNEGTRDVVLEHACLRLQAALLGPLGLRHALGPTTDYRAFYNALPPDPFDERSPDERESIVRARAAYGRRTRAPWREHLTVALEATATILQATRAASDGGDLLFSVVEPRAAHNRVGLPLHHDEQLTCESCAWSYGASKTHSRLKCRQADDSTTAGERACERYEARFDCLGCGACCREAYDTVEVGPRDPAKKLHLALMVERNGGLDMQRTGPRCVCLQGGIELTPPRPHIDGGSAEADAGERLAPRIMPGGDPFTCSIYETRPKTCRDFTIYSDHCLTARRTVGLSR